MVCPRGLWPRPLLCDHCCSCSPSEVPDCAGCLAFQMSVPCGLSGQTREEGLFPGCPVDPTPRVRSGLSRASRGSHWPWRKRRTSHLNSVLSAAAAAAGTVTWERGEVAGSPAEKTLPLHCHVGVGTPPAVKVGPSVSWNLTTSLASPLRTPRKPFCDLLRWIPCLFSSFCHAVQSASLVAVFPVGFLSPMWC